MEKLYRARWGSADGVGCIIITPTRELAGQIFEVLKAVGKYHGFSAGLLIGGRSDVEAEQEHVNDLNILVCTPGRLLQHMDMTPNFECSQLQVKVTDLLKLTSVVPLVIHVDTSCNIYLFNLRILMENGSSSIISNASGWVTKTNVLKLWTVLFM